MEGPYGTEELIGIYELGRMYFEMGYFAPAERIFSGLVAVDSAPDGKRGGSQTPARLALGILKIERALYPEALIHLRAALELNQNPLETKIAITAAFVATNEMARAKSLLSQIVKDHGAVAKYSPDLRSFWQALWARVS